MSNGMKDFPLEKWFLTIALFIGGLLIFLIPPMASPDENDHFYNSIAFSETNWLPEIQDDMRGRILPTCTIDFVTYYNDRFAGNLNEKYDFAEAYTSWAIETDFKPHSFCEYWNSNVSLIAYVPSGIGMLIYRNLAKILPVIVSPYNLLIIGRICNLFFYISMIYLAIKWTPILKGTMFLISLLPMSIFLASTLSYDTVIIGCSMLLFARTTRILNSKELISRRDLIIIGFCSIMFCSVKQAYAPMLIVLFSIPIVKFGNLKTYIKYASVTIFAGLIPYALFSLGRMLVEKNFVWKYAGAMEEQKKVILQAPLHFIENIGNSFSHVGEFYYAGMLGCLGQLDTNLPIVILYMLSILIVFFSIYEISSQNIITVKFKLCTLIGLVVTIYTMFAGTYIIWTGIRYSIGLNYVEGIQGRYFIPLYLWICILFSNSKLLTRYKWENLMTKIAIGICIYSLLITLICIFLRFWV